VRAVRLAVLALSVVALAGCSDGAASDDGDTVVASFYPLAWAVEHASRGVRVVDLTPPGVEPHDVELTPSDTKTIDDARLVLFLSGGFQPAVEDAVAARTGPVLDVRGGSTDPHVWLDPVRFAGIVERVGRALGPPSSTAPVVRELRALDAEYRRGLRDCDRRTIVTTHAAFGLLARRYGLHQLSLAGRTPEAEPGPRDLEHLIDDVRASGATTVFAEPLVSQRVIRTVAREAHAGVAVLDPIEGLSSERLDAGEDYVSVMRDNLAVLRKALGCR
jgi:zinc transport system substrate-binding protein